VTAGARGPGFNPERATRFFLEVVGATTGATSRCWPQRG